MGIPLHYICHMEAMRTNITPSVEAHQMARLNWTAHRFLPLTLTERAMNPYEQAQMDAALAAARIIGNVQAMLAFDRISGPTVDDLQKDVDAYEAAMKRARQAA